MEMLAHEHPLTLIDLNPEYPHDKEVYDDEEDLIAKQAFQHPCHRCYQEITYLHRYYYKCDQCDYSLHQLCGELPTTLIHASHSEHTLTLFLDESQKGCHMCKSIIEDKKLQYHCSWCMLTICLDCGMDKKQYHIIYHPSHQHPLIPICSKKFNEECDACGRTHEGIFYQCITCFRVCIHNDCVFQQKRLLIQDVTNGNFFHTHPLTLTYSFPIKDQNAKFNPKCRVCNMSFSDKENLWLYKCEKCRYYIHLECVIYRWKSWSVSQRFSIPSIVNVEKSSLPFVIIRLPLSDGTYNTIKELLFKETSNEMRLTRHNSHQHPLILVDSTHAHTTTVGELCNGCVRPIKEDIPYYKCTSGCNFLLHAFCTRFPTELKFGHPYYQQHTLVLVPKVPRNSLGLFLCRSCDSPCNGFAYSCVDCDYIVDVRCAFLPNIITHKSHPHHVLTRFRTRDHVGCCGICLSDFTYDDKTAYRCQYCNFYLHTECAVLLPDTIRHKYDKHPMTLTYGPLEDYGGDYFCDVCEEELNPYISFYHCHKCAQSIHVACAPVIPPAQGKPFFGSGYTADITYDYVNIKGGTIYKTEDHPHPLSILKGTEDDGWCSKKNCIRRLKGNLILKCLECKFAIDIHCLK